MFYEGFRIALLVVLVTVNEYGSNSCDCRSSRSTRIHIGLLAPVAAVFVDSIDKYTCIGLLNAQVTNAPVFLIDVLDHGYWLETRMETIQHENNIFHYTYVKRLIYLNIYPSVKFLSPKSSSLIQ